MNDNVFGNAIFTYTREEAINDGVLIDLNKFIPIKESGYKYPVCCTFAVWAIIDKAVENKKYCNDFEGIIWDILSMSKHGREISPSTNLFTVFIAGAGNKRNFTFKIICHPGDKSEPVLTILLPDED